MKLTLLLLLLGGFYHWRPNAEVKVFFMPGFSSSQKQATMRGLESWQQVGGVRFTIASDVAEMQTCDDCLTLRRAKPVSGTLAQISASYFNGSGVIQYAVIDIEAKGEKEVQSLVAHETGHVLGLDDCSCDSVMSKRGWLSGWPLPSQRDIELVRSYYAGLYGTPPPTPGQ